MEKIAVSTSLDLPAQNHPSDLAPTVQVRIRGFRRGNQHLIKALDFTLRGGQFVVLLGASGVGKSSLLRLVAGLLGPDDHAQALSVTDETGRDLTGRVAYLDQRDFLLPWASVIDNVMLGARLRGEPCDRAKALALLAEVGLSERQADFPRQLSGGMRQRVALARTLMEDRPVVLLDEPFAQLDALTRTQMQDLASRLLRGKTCLMVSHDPWEAARLADRLLVMRSQNLEGALSLSEIAAPLAPAPRDFRDPQVLGAEAALLNALGAAPRWLS